MECIGCIAVAAFAVAIAMAGRIALEGLRLASRLASSAGDPDEDEDEDDDDDIWKEWEEHGGEAWTRR